MEGFINKGVISVNVSKEKKEEKTVVVLGVARSGTSMVASVLDQLGVFMGNQKDDVVVEDMEVASLLEQDGKEDEFDRLVEERNSKYKIWGWKRPGAIDYVKKFEDKIVNPHFIVVFRDSLAIAIRNNISAKTNLFENLLQTNRQYIKVVKFISSTKHPCLLISYEKAILKKALFVKAVIDFLGLEPTGEEVRKAVETVSGDKREYLLSARVDKIRGQIDRLIDGELRGWAFRDNSPDPVELDIYVNGNFVDSIRADIFREDLKAHGIGSGNHSFCIKIDAFLQEDKVNKISVVTKIDKIELNKSPLKIKI